MTEKVVAICSLCKARTETTWDALQEDHKCPKCSHGDLVILYGEYSQIERDIFQVAKYLSDVEDLTDRRRLAKPITDLLRKTKK